MHKSERYDYEKRPDWDRADKFERKHLRKVHRRNKREELAEYRKRKVR